MNDSSASSFRPTNPSVSRSFSRFRPVRVVLAADLGIVRAALACLIETQGDMTVVAEADGEQAAVALALALRPDVVVMDIVRPALSLAAAVRAVKQGAPDAKLLVLIQDGDTLHRRALLMAHADGYFVKEGRAGSTDAFFAALCSVAAGGTYLDPALAAQGGRALLVAERKLSLTARERDVLNSTACGYTNKEIAGLMGLSVKTVETHKAHGLQKLGLSSRVELMRYAAQNGWFDAAENQPA